jgi:hypothetical protein
VPILLLLVFLLHQFSSLPARAIVDHNGNGVSDIWELDVNNQELFTNFDPTADDDGDGWSNGTEAIAGTLHQNPNPPAGILAPAFRIAPAVYETLPGGGEELVTPESFVLTWTGVIGKRYNLQWTDDLTSGYWITLGSLLCDGTPMEGGRPVDVAPNAFFRIAISDYDEDADGLTNWEEHRLGTDPALADSDDDGMPDGWEMANDLDPNVPTDANGDADGDSLSNLLEFTLHTDPTLIDTDGDGLEDGEEVNTYHTDPALHDTDGDTLSDGDEIDPLETNPLNVDSDGDWIDDAFEVFYLNHPNHPLNPNNPADGLADADGDGLLNQLEFVFASEGFDLFVANDPATFPWLLDPDGDELSTLAEFTGTPRTNPVVNLDTDGDGLPDDWERQHYLDPTKGTGVDGTDGDPDTDDLLLTTSP